MGHFNRQSILATFGNYPVAAAGRTIHLPNADFPNVKSGELFVESNNVTIAVGAIPTASNIKIGVGIGPKNGPATTVRYLAGEEINLCDSRMKARVSPPVCGIQQVVDVFLNGCISCKETYSFAVNLDDAFVRSNFSENEKVSYVFTETAECCASCDTCDSAANPEDLICKFVDRVNGKTQTDPSKITRFVYADMKEQYQPFGAVRLFSQTTLGAPETTRTFCIDPVDSECANCVNFTGITGISVEGVVTQFQNTAFSEVVGEDTVYTSTHAHIKSIMNQINLVLEPLGARAFLKHGIGNCCDYSIEINSCADEILLLSGAEEIVPCASTNPFATFDIESVCKGCGVSPTEIAPAYGFRLYVDPIEVPCNCEFPPNVNPPSYYGRTIDVQPAGDAWECQSFFTEESTTQVIPEGFGYFWQDLAYLGQHRGGSGRDFRYNNRHRGRFHLPDESSRALNAAKGIDCEGTYCVYNVTTTTTKERFFNNATLNVNTDIDWVLVPHADTVTQASWESYLAALQLRGICQAGSIDCVA